MQQATSPCPLGIRVDRRQILIGSAVTALLAGGGPAAWAEAPRRGASNVPVLGTDTVVGLERAIDDYAGIVSRGGWRPVPGAERLRVGARGQGVSLLRARLAATGDLGGNRGGDLFDGTVDAAVRRFQMRHGISPDGQLRASTLAALNVPAEMRLRQLETNLVRVRAYSGFLGNRYVVLNIPAAEAEAVEDNTVVSRHVAIVGKADRQSPVISSRIADINFNPYWTIPPSIIRRDLIPKMQAEPDYLFRNRIRIFNAEAQEVDAASVNWNSTEALRYRFRQDPFEGNSLGNVRINIPNVHAVYMHDTPAKGLFDEDQRFHSSGCARIQDIRGLIAWALQGTPWTRSEIDHVLQTDERIDARPAQPIPVYWVYVTAWSSPGGVVRFRQDVYERDGISAQLALSPQR
ncbi:MAG: L,D-transpeptidase family protein [Phreatobacter sp.]